LRTSIAVLAKGISLAPVLESGAGSTTSTYAYNTLGWQLRVTDADGFATTRVFDKLGRTISETTATETTTSTYDAAGHLTKQVDHQGRWRELSYDLMGRATGDLETLPGTPRVSVKDTTLTYDSLGRVLTTSDAVRNLDHTLTYPVNTPGPTTDQAVVGTTGTDAVQTTLTVAADGYETSRASEIDSNPALPTITRTVGPRDAAHRLTEATTQTGPSTSIFAQYLYDSAGRLKRQWGPTGVAGSGYLAGATTTDAYTYHPTTGLKTGENLRLQSVGTAGVLTASYTYTTAGRLATATVNGVSDTTTFDPAGNLTSFTGTTLTYQNNILQTSVTGGATTYYTYDGGKRWRLSQGTTTNTSDPNRIRYTYTAQGRLATYLNPSTSVSAAYTYDERGQRTRSAVTVGSQTTTTDFSYQGLQLQSLKATQSGGTNPTSWQITYLYDEQGRPYGGVYRSPKESATPLYFGILTSDRGDVLSLLDGAGAPFAAYRYDAWGKPTGTGNVSTGVWSKSTSLISAAVASAIANRQILRYASYAYDAESTLYYLSSRSYDPVTRQFLSKDLSRNDGEESAYQYCGGNPVAGVDPTGYRMDEFATSQERQAADISRGRIKKAQRAKDARRRLLKNCMERSSRGSDILPREARNAVAWYEERYTATGNPAYAVGKFLAMPFTERYIGTTLLVMSLGRGGKGGSKLQPDPRATGPHTTFRVDPSIGRVTKWATWQPQSNPQSPNPWEMTARLDLSGKMHYNKLTQELVPVPHIHGPGIPGGVRLANPAEVPNGW